MNNQPTVTEIFRRAVEMRRVNPNASYSDLNAQLVSEFSGREFPSTAFLTIPEYDNITPEEDWSAGLPVIMRGISNKDWKELMHGIVISIDQIENYPKESGREDAPDKEWRNRGKTISEAEKKVLEKWMPAELIALAETIAPKPH